MFKSYVSVPRVSDNRRRKKILTWSPLKRKEGKDPKIKEVRRVMKQKNLRREEAINRKVWRKLTANQ